MLHVLPSTITITFKTKSITSDSAQHPSHHIEPSHHILRVEKVGVTAGDVYRNMTNRQGSGRKRTPDLLTQEPSDLEVRELRNQVAELQRKLKAAESPDPRLLRTCESLRQDRERLEEEVNTLKRKNLELSAQTGDERRVLESNEQLRQQLAEAAAREQKLDGKYRRVAAKFKEIKGSVGNLGEKYKKLIQDKQAADQERIELMNRQIQDNEEKAQLQTEIEKQKQKISLAESEKEALHVQLQKHKASVVKVMKHYQEAKVRKERAEERVKEICKINDTNIEQLKRCMDVLQKRNNEIEELKKQNAELQEENEGFAEKLGQLETQMSTLEERCSSTQSRIADDKGEVVAGLQEENRELQQEIEVLKQKLTLAVSRQEVGKDEEESLKAKNEGLALQVRTLQATLKKLKQAMEEARADYEERLSKELMDKQKLEEKVRKMGRSGEVDELKKENASLRDECKDWKETCMELEAANRELQERLETVLNEFVSSVETESDATTKKTSALQTMAREINDLKESNRYLMEMLQQTENQLKKERESHSGDLQDKVNELTRQNAQLSKENNDLRQEVATVKDTDYDAIVEELAELRDQNRQLLQQLEEVHEENESLQAANDVSSDQAGKSVKKLTDELNSSIEENKELRSSVKSLKRENRMLRNSLEKDHISAINESIEYVRSSLSEIGPDVASMSQAYRLEAENEELRMKLEELTNQIAEQKRITDDMIGDTEFAAMVDQLESLRSRNRELEATVDKYRQGVGETGLAAILAELEETRQKVEKLEKEKTALETKYASGSQNVISSDEETFDSILSKNEEQLQHELKELKRENELLRKQIDSSDGELATALSNLSQKKEQELQAQIAALKQQIKDNSGGDEQYTELLEQQMKVIAENARLKETCNTLQQQVLELRRESRPYNDPTEEEAKPDEDDIDQEILEDVERMEKSSSIRVKLDKTSEESEGIIEEESLPDDLASLDENWQDLSLDGSEEGEVVEGRRHDDYVSLPQDVLDEEEDEDEQELQLNEKVKALVNAEEMWDQILASDIVENSDQGIVASLTGVCGGNIADKKIVEVTSTEPCEMTSAQFVLDLDEDNCFTSKPDKEAFFCIDFQHLSVTPQRYMLRTIDEPAGAGHLRNWVVEVRTNEDDEWTVIDQRTDDSKLNGKSNEVVYDVTNPVQCRMIRLRMTGPNHARDDGDVQHQLNCAAFEIFGSVL